MDNTLILPRLESFEGRIPHMYRCTGGKVTVGIGHAIETADDAVKLGFTVGGAPAPEDQVRADYARVAAAPLGLEAHRYAGLSTCRIDNSTIDSLAASDVETFTAQIAAQLPNWNQFPNCVQMALFDMAFNLGLGGLLRFHNLLAACNSADWETAAKESHRQGIGEDRNQQTAAMFRQALAKTDQASA